MGNISTILAAILCATAPLASVEAQDPKTEMVQSNFKLGKETVSAVRTAYANGEYNEFFSEMDASYKEADLAGLVQMRSKEIPLEFQEQWEQQFIDLRNQKNAELLNVLSDKDNSPFAQKVRSVAAQLATPEQEKALTKLNAFIAMAPGTGANEDENAIIDIDVRSEFEQLHSDQGQDHQLALRMKKMDEMVKASQSFKDHSLKQAVSIASASLDQRLARNLDGSDLNALVKGKVKPSNETEEQVFSILSSYQGQFSDLMKQLDHANR